MGQGGDFDEVVAAGDRSPPVATIVVRRERVGKDFEAVSVVPFEQAVQEVAIG